MARDTLLVRISMTWTVTIAVVLLVISVMQSDAAARSKKASRRVTINGSFDDHSVRQSERSIHSGSLLPRG
jgi:hypothetical protein